MKDKKILSPQASTFENSTTSPPLSETDQSNKDSCFRLEGSTTLQKALWWDRMRQDLTVCERMTFHLHKAAAHLQTPTDTLNLLRGVLVANVRGYAVWTEIMLGTSGSTAQVEVDLGIIAKKHLQELKIEDDFARAMVEQCHVILDLQVKQAKNAAILPIVALSGAEALIGDGTDSTDSYSTAVPTALDGGPRNQSLTDVPTKEFQTSGRSFTSDTGSPRRSSGQHQPSESTPLRQTTLENLSPLSASHVSDVEYDNNLEMSTLDIRAPIPIFPSLKPAVSGCGNSDFTTTVKYSDVIRGFIPQSEPVRTYSEVVNSRASPVHSVSAAAANWSAQWSRELLMAPGQVLTKPDDAPQIPDSKFIERPLCSQTLERFRSGKASPRSLPRGYSSQVEFVSYDPQRSIAPACKKPTNGDTKAKFVESGWQKVKKKGRTSPE